MTGALIQAAAGAGPTGKGLKGGALGFISSVVIGVASTAPGYSLATALGLVTAAVGFQAPAIMWLAFLPTLFIAAAYFYLNKADPDCGTTFSWATRAFSPWVGWLGGWVIIVTDVFVMPSLAEIAGRYSLLLVGARAAAGHRFWVVLVGVAWIAVLTAICYRGIELSARTQWLLLATEIATLIVFSIVALVKVYSMASRGMVRPTWEWVNPFAIDSTSALTAGLLAAVFIYWGWDTTLSVNEETESSSVMPGLAALTSTIALVTIYVLVSIAGVGVHGPEFLSAHSDDVLSALGTAVLAPPWDRLLIFAVLTSALASTQTTILPTTRTVLSMAAHGAIPPYFARIEPRFQTPSTATIWMGVCSIAWYTGLSLVSENVLLDSVASLGLMIALYYALTGLACVWFYRREVLTSARKALLIGVVPLTGTVIMLAVLVRSVVDLAKPEKAASHTSWGGFGPPLVIAIGALVLGIGLMLARRWSSGEFFQRGIAAPE